MNNKIYELRQELAREEKRVDKAKAKRAIITILFIAAVFAGLAIYMDRQNGFNISILEFIGGLLGCVFLAGFYFWINAMIFCTLASKAQAEDRMLENMRKELAELEKQERNNK
jgi:hypothetical protein